MASRAYTHMHTHTHTHKHTRILSWMKVIIRNQVHTGHRPASAWFTNGKIMQRV